MAIEIVANMGGMVGKTTFDTAELVGTLCYINELHGKPITRLKRYDVLKHFGYKRRTKKNGLPVADTQLRQALAERFSKDPNRNYGKGIKSNPDFFYGFNNDIYSAFAVGVCAIERKEKGNK